MALLPAIMQRAAFAEIWLAHVEFDEVLLGSSLRGRPMYRTQRISGRWSVRLSAWHAFLPIRVLALL